MDGWRNPSTASLKTAWIECDNKQRVRYAGVALWGCRDASLMRGEDVCPKWVGQMFVLPTLVAKAFEGPAPDMNNR